jgi:hypothetical protein
MTHTCDFMGWETAAANSYYIAATPTLFLLGPQNTIIGKYSGFKAMRSAFDKLNTNDNP